MADYLWQLINIYDESQSTLIVGVMNVIMRNKWMHDLNPVGLGMAGGVILFVPMFVTFAICQRYFKAGIDLGGLK
jgi:ABC-type glycerol-3-phosphate transport system permease component